MYSQTYKLFYHFNTSEEQEAENKVMAKLRGKAYRRRLRRFTEVQ